MVKTKQKKQGSGGNARTRKGFTLIEIIVVLAIIGMFILFAMPNHLNQMDRASVAIIQNDVLRVESMLREQNVLNPAQMFRWGHGNPDMLVSYQEEGLLYDRDGHVERLSPLNTRYVPKEVVQGEFYSELEGHFFLNLEGTVYYVDDPDAPVPDLLGPHSEIVPGEGWTYADFVYEENTLMGFSASGEAKYNEGLTSFVMPDINPYQFSPITEIAYRAFRRTEFTGEFDAPGVEEIGQEAFRFSRFTGDFNAPLLREVDNNTFRESKFDGRFLAPNIVVIPPDAFRESRFTGDFYAPKVKSIGGGAFQLSTFDGEFHAPNVESIGSQAFRDSQFTNGRWGGSS